MSDADQRPSTSDEIWVCHLGTVAYGDALALQERVRARRQAEELPDTLLLLEHPPVYTRGRRSGAERAAASARTSTALAGIEVFDTDRGGKRHLPRPRPARRLSDHAHRRRRSLPARDGRRDRRRARRAGHPRPLAPRRGHRLHGRVGGGPQDRLDRRARLARRHHPRLRRQRRERPRAVLLGHRLRPARRDNDLARAGARAAPPTGRSRAFASASPTPAPARTVGASAWSRAAPRHRNYRRTAR